MKAKRVGDRFYWDSCTFLAWLLPERARAPRCKEVIDSSAVGESLIVTSTLTLTEVVKLKGLPPLKEDQEAKIRAFFENDYIVLRGVDRFVAEDARRLVWQHGVKPKDSIHLATALRWDIGEMHTFDKGLLGLDGKLGGKSKLKICEPAARQRRITDPPKEDEAALASPEGPASGQLELTGDSDLLN